MSQISSAAPSSSTLPSAPARIDVTLLLAALMLLVLGLVMVGSASLATAERMYSGEALALLQRQVIAVALGLITAALVFMLPLRFFQRAALPLLMVTVAALIVLVLPGVVDPLNGASRWVRVFGFSLQLSELAKVVFLIFIAAHLQRKRDPEHLQQLLSPLLALIVLVALFALQPDFGSVVVLTTVTLGVLFVASVRPLQLVGVGAALAVPLTLLAFNAGYRTERIRCFLDLMSIDNVSGCAYQQVQALIAVGRGELFGVGLGDSLQKLDYLPEAYNDFLLAVLAEELGLVGVALVIALYAVVIARCFMISAAAGRRGQTFAELLTYGIGLLLAVQACIHIGVNLGVLPAKGLTLPLLSYGGSSMIAACASLALVMRADYELRAPVRRRGRQ